MATRVHKTLFGGERDWDADNWTASDDRVRGGRSQSHLKIKPGYAVFHGHLDIDTLGGAGFASQRTKGDDKHWDLSGANAIELLLDPVASDEKRYAFILKDEILPPNPENGREQSTTSWEYEFSVRDGTPDQQSPHLTSITVPFGDFKPTYRGKGKDPGRPLRSADIRRISIMMRSYFGDQKGNFSLSLRSIAAINTCHGPDQESELDSSERGSTYKPDNSSRAPDQVKSSNFWTRLLAMCNKL